MPPLPEINMTSRQDKVRVVSNRQVATGYFKIVLEAPAIARCAKPGNFVMVKVSEGLEPFLRRPLGIHRVSSASIELLYEVIGKGTRILSQVKPGDHLLVIGPLGNGFKVNSAKGVRPVLVAGGMGVAPLVFLAEKLKAQKPLVLLGAQTKTKLLCRKDFFASGCQVQIATDDGSQGFKGRVTWLLAEAMSKEQPLVIYACGPSAMLKEVSRLARHHGLPAQLSLESHMACGIGACLGCVVKTESGYKRVCKEGPVFDAQEIYW